MDLSDFITINPNFDIGDNYIEFNKKNNINKIIIFDCIRYLSNIYKSYNFDITKINNQFNIDFPRSKIYLNNNLIQLNYFLSKISKFKTNKIVIATNNLNFDIFLKMICTQASFALSYSILNKFYTKPTIGQHVLSKNIEIYLNFTSINLNIKLIGYFDLFNILENKKINNIKIDLDLDMILAEKIILFKYGIIGWDIY